MKLILKNFSGIAPKIAPRLLPEKLAQKAYNTKLNSGELRPHYLDTALLTIPSSTKSIYRYKYKNQKYNWLCFPKKTYVAKGPVYNDDNNRIYLMTDDDFRVTDSSLLQDKVYENGVDEQSYKVAIPAPASGYLSVNGVGDGDIESRSYVVCLVRKWSDETIDVGKSSDPWINKDDHARTTVDVRPGQAVVVDGIYIPDDYLSRGINRVFIYRSEVTSSGQALYSYVDEFNVNEAHWTNNSKAVWKDGWYTYEDVKANTELGESCPSLYWDAPVDGLRGMVSLQNGLFAAFKGSEIYVSDWNAPHAWPYEHKVVLDYPIVGLGVFGSTIVACTEAAPVLIVEQDPTQPTVKPIQENCPCVSADSIVSTGTGVIFASKSGLYQINNTKPNNLTEKLITQDEWEPLNPESLMSVFIENAYYGFFGDPLSTAAGFVFDFDNYATYYGQVTDSGLTYTTQKAKVVFNDVEQSQVYVCFETNDRRVYTLFSFTTDSRVNKTYTWRSKVYTSSDGLYTFSVARVNCKRLMGKENPGDMSHVYLRKRAINELAINESPLGGRRGLDDSVYLRYDYTMFNYFVDGVLRYSREIKDSKPFRLPSGFRGEEFEVEITSNAWIHSIELASSMAELVHGENK